MGNPSLSLSEVLYPSLYVHWYWLIFRHDLDWDLHIIFDHLYQSNDPWFTPEFCFCSISLEQTDWFSLNFIYAFILIRSSLGLLHVIFGTFVPELWPLLYAKILYPLNVLRTNWLIVTKFCIYAFILIRSRLGLLHMIFRTFVLVLWPLIYARFLFPLNILCKNDRFSFNFIHSFLLTRSRFMTYL